MQKTIYSTCSNGHACILNSLGKAKPRQVQTSAGINDGTLPSFDRESSSALTWYLYCASIVDGCTPRTVAGSQVPMSGCGNRGPGRPNGLRMAYIGKGTWDNDKALVGSRQACGANMRCSVSICIIRTDLNPTT